LRKENGCAARKLQRVTNAHRRELSRCLFRSAPQTPSLQPKATNSTSLPMKPKTNEWTAQLTFYAGLLKENNNKTRTALSE